MQYIEITPALQNLQSQVKASTENFMKFKGALKGKKLKTILIDSSGLDMETIILQGWLEIANHVHVQELSKDFELDENGKPDLKSLEGDFR